MTKIDIFSGFLGAGKTTLIRKLIQEAYAGEKLVLIENEFGEIGIDGGFLQDAGVEITEMNSGCICCSLVGDFGEALQKVLDQFHPDRILIEPSGVGKLSDVIQAVQDIHAEGVSLNAFVTVADATKCKMYMKNFGEFFNNQIEHAAAIVLSRTDGMPQDKLLATVALLREHNADAPIVTTPWDQLTGQLLLETMENKDTLQAELSRLAAEHPEPCPVCGGHHSHDHHDHEEEHEHHHHDGACCHDHAQERHHDHDCGCHDHEHHQEHHHDHEEEAACGCGHSHHHHDGCGCGHDHDHDADEVFQSWGMETPRQYTEEELTAALSGLEDEHACGLVLRAKGILPGADGSWFHFDYVPGEASLRKGSAQVTGRLCVIGAALREDQLARLFQLQ